jgi:beta-lactamase superfamily II metal-dependent hydrolase
LNSEKPEVDFYHNDLISIENYDLQNRQLLLSASKAFVFGGMGSWNDMGFENEETNKKYNELSTELYNTMNQAIVCAINNDRIEKPVANNV